jgi:hypothetical protein
LILSKTAHLGARDIDAESSGRDGPYRGEIMMDAVLLPSCSSSTLPSADVADAANLSEADMADVSLPSVDAELLCHLERVSRRETSLPGLPTGALLVERRNASTVTGAFREAMLQTVGKTSACVMHAPLRRAASSSGSASSQWLLYPLSSQAAALLPDLLAAAEPSDAVRVLKAKSQFWPGVRRYDAFFVPLAEANRQPLASGLERGAVSGSIDAVPTDGAGPGGRTFTFAELFAGIGGFRYGLEPLGGRCVYASEVDRAAQETYITNFGDAGLGGDITDVYACDLPKFDWLTGGFPCQPFSQRGEQQGFEDASNGQLYAECVRMQVLTTASRHSRHRSVVHRVRARAHRLPAQGVPLRKRAGARAARGRLALHGGRRPMAPSHPVATWRRGGRGALYDAARLCGRGL